jgi:ADP-heptose:LPS heptosyltransferase
LAIRPGGIGDTILSFPALQHLQPAEVWMREEVLPLWPGSRSLVAAGVDRILDTAPAGLFAGFDEIHSWYGAKRPEFRAALEAVHPRVFWYDALPPAASTQHAADFFACQTGALTPAFPEIAVAARPNRIVWIHPFSGSQQKNWPLENFALLARYLEAAGRSVQFLRAPHQNLPGAQVFENLRELGEYLAGGSLYIGNDCGITHLAAAVGAPTIAIFATTDARVWAPRGKSVEVLLRPNIDTVLAAALK